MEAFKAGLVLDFWFNELTPKQWFVKDEALDQLIAERFSAVHKAARCGELSLWRYAEPPLKAAEGRLAEIIVLDQFSRNIYRDDGQAFAQDPHALCLAQEAVQLGLDAYLSVQQKPFMYMPFMHSESLLVHQQAEPLFRQEGLQHTFEFERKHVVILERFARYPHRNSMLGRDSSAEELAFLQEPGSGF